MRLDWNQCDRAGWVRLVGCAEVVASVGEFLLMAAKEWKIVVNAKARLK
jgi:hypothetical protein